MSVNEFTTPHSTFSVADDGLASGGAARSRHEYGRRAEHGAAKSRLGIMALSFVAVLGTTGFGHAQSAPLCADRAPAVAKNRSYRSTSPDGGAYTSGRIWWWRVPSGGTNTFCGLVRGRVWDKGGHNTVFAKVTNHVDGVWKEGRAWASKNHPVHDYSFKASEPIPFAFLVAACTNKCDHYR